MKSAPVGRTHPSCARRADLQPQWEPVRRWWNRRPRDMQRLCERQSRLIDALLAAEDLSRSPQTPPPSRHPSWEDDGGGYRSSQQGLLPTPPPPPPPPPSAPCQPHHPDPHSGVANGHNNLPMDLLKKEKPASGPSH
ncbi:unnamed protein product [Boreogadus saida]